MNTYAFLRAVAGFALVLSFALFSGCDTLEDLFEDEQEVEGIVEAVGEDFLTVEANRYTVTDDTEFEGYTGLGDIEVGDEVEVEYEERGGGRVALEVEDAASDDD